VPIPPALFASLVLLTAAAKIKEKMPIKTGASSKHITNLKQSILETFDIYGYDSVEESKNIKEKKIPGSLPARENLKKCMKMKNNNLKFVQ
jgi:hypothetical protein